MLLRTKLALPLPQHTVFVRGCRSVHAAAQAYTDRFAFRRQRGVRAAPQSSGAEGCPARTAVSLRAIAGGQEASSVKDRSDAAVKAMEVEVKIRLPDAAAHAKVAALLCDSQQEVHAQENYFFDGSEQELGQQRVVLRLRFYNKDRKAVVTLKGKQILVDGIGRASEVEAEVEPVAARAYLQQPDGLLGLDIAPITSLKSLSPSPRGLVCLGGFENQRQEYAWQGHTLELDETRYEWGTLYELECETDKPEQLRAELEALLSGAGIAYSYSATSKFANFRNRTLE